MCYLEEVYRRSCNSVPKGPIPRNLQPLVSRNPLPLSIEELRLRDDFVAKTAFGRNDFGIVEDGKISVSPPILPCDDVFPLPVSEPVERHAVALSILVRHLAVLCPGRIPALAQSVVFCPCLSTNVAEEPHSPSFFDLPISVFLLVGCEWDAAAQLVQLLIDVVLGTKSRNHHEPSKDRERCLHQSCRIK